jgi:hypothetical protein
MTREIKINKCIAITSFDIIVSWPIPGQSPNLIKIKTGDLLEFERLKVKFNKKKRVWKIVRPNQIGTIINRIYLSNKQIDEISDDDFKVRYTTIPFLREEKLNKILKQNNNNSL